MRGSALRTRYHARKRSVIASLPSVKLPGSHFALPWLPISAIISYKTKVGSGAIQIESGITERMELHSDELPDGLKIDFVG